MSRMKLLILIPILSSLAICLADDWKVNAWSWLCKEVGKGHDNQEIATGMVSYLSMAHYPNKFSILIADENKTLGDEMIGYLVNEDELISDTNPDGAIDVTLGALCSRNMIAIQIENSLALKCTGDAVIDENLLNTYLNLSLSGGSLVDATAMDVINTVRSTQGLGFDYMAVLATSDKSIAAVASSTPNDCDGKYESKKVMIGYFGFKDNEDSSSDYKKLATKTLMEALAENAASSNEDLAVKVNKALVEVPGNDFNWITSVLPYRASTNNDDFAYFLNGDWDTNKFLAENIAGRSLFVSGINGIADQYRKCTRPIDAETFRPFISTAMAKANTTQDLLDNINEGDQLLGFESEVILVSKSIFGVESFTFMDCTFEHHEGKWTVLYYGLPLV